MSFLAGFLGLGRPTALAILASSLELPEVFRASLGDLLPTLLSKLDGGGIFLLRQNSEGLAQSPGRIMHDLESGSNASWDRHSISHLFHKSERQSAATLPQT